MQGGLEKRNCLDPDASTHLSNMKSTFKRFSGEMPTLQLTLLEREDHCSRFDRWRERNRRQVQLALRCRSGPNGRGCVHDVGRLSHAKNAPGSCGTLGSLHDSWKIRPSCGLVFAFQFITTCGVIPMADVVNIEFQVTNHHDKVKTTMTRCAWCSARRPV